ncbi:hypothetical protein RJD44_00300 [Buchnera aphidicola (Astegopteryx bambusae)]|uniref:hypothetical protein n=1 Tax=Buchnera aphidicola TaxID=9 RepID=UPI0031B8120E
MKNKIRLISFLILLEKIKLKKICIKFFNLLNFEKSNLFNINALNKYKKIYVKKNNILLSKGTNVFKIQNINNFLILLNKNIVKKNNYAKKIFFKKNMFIKTIVKNKNKIKILKFLNLSFLNRLNDDKIYIYECNNEELINIFFKKNFV